MLSYLKNIYWIIVAAIGLLSAASLTSLASFGRPLFARQALWLGLGFFIIIFACRINWRWLLTNGWFVKSFYWFSVVLIFAANFQSETIRGTKSWIIIGGFRFQPVELVKVSLILILADFFAKKGDEAWLHKNIALSFFYAMLPAGIVILHPDLGSAMVIVAVWLGFLFTAGFHIKRAAAILVFFVLAGALSWFFVMKPYQKDRLTGFLFPEKDPLGVNYNVAQSKIAIGSAGFLGKGFNFGTQTHLKFLPEAETDFIFAGFVEEWGVFGGLVILLTFIILLFRITRIGINARGGDLKFLSIGVALVLAVHLFVNAGSTLGITPVTGIPLPFLSYGGSSVLTLATLLSIMENIKLGS